MTNYYQPPQWPDPSQPFYDQSLGRWMYWNPVTQQWQSVPLQAPRVLTTLWITIFFGIFGFIPAIIHGAQARQMGKPASPYWLTYVCTLLAIIVLLAVIGSLG